MSLIEVDTVLARRMQVGGYRRCRHGCYRWRWLIENGGPTGIEVLNRYVHALSGDLPVVAFLGVEQVDLGWPVPGR